MAEVLKREQITAAEAVVSRPKTRSFTGAPVVPLTKFDTVEATERAREQVSKQLGVSNDSIQVSGVQFGNVDLMPYHNLDGRPRDPVSAVTGVSQKTFIVRTVVVVGGMFLLATCAVILLPFGI